MRLGRVEFRCLVVVVSLGALTAPARAQDGGPQPTQEPAAPTVVAPAPSIALRPDARRRWGFGSVLGGGYAIGVGRAGAATVQTEGGALMLPTIELRFFPRTRFSVDLSIPLTNTIAISAFTGVFLFSADAYFTFNVGNRIARFQIGPGLGFSVGSGAGVTFGALRIPAQVGIELLTPHQRFGFQLYARPWFEVGGGSNTTTSVTVLGGGVIAGVGFAGYSVR
jgi:hypothetical protein